MRTEKSQTSENRISVCSSARSPTMPADIDTLLELAKKATPGEWRADPCVGEGGSGMSLGDYDVGYGESGPEFRNDDAAYIAAMNPATAIDILTELRTLREQVGTLKGKGNG